MIVLGKDKTLDNYFIDENGVITDQFGNVQKIGGKIRPYFKGQCIHKIMMYTFYGWRDGHQWAIHHLDENKKNNSLNNLVYLTRSEHMRLHSLNRSEETKRKNRIVHLGNKNMYGKHHSKETKQKMSAARKGKHWFNDGIKNYFEFTCPDKCQPGKLNKK